MQKKSCHGLMTNPFHRWAVTSNEQIFQQLENEAKGENHRLDI